MKSFGGATELLAIAEDLEELTTRCKCGEIAQYVARTYKGEYVSEGEEVVIKGSDKDIDYIPMCGKCYLQKVKKIEL